MPEPPPLIELVERWRELQRQGQAISPETLCADCPERLPELKQHLQAVAAMESFLGLAVSPAAEPNPRAEPMSLTLTVIEGPHQGQTFTFAAHDTFLVGRSPDVHFSLPDKDRYFSRVHFLIEVNPPLCRLLDMKSHNGTLVNGRRVQTSDLKDGDLIKAGTTVLRVSVAGGPPGTPAPAVPDPARTLSTPPVAEPPAFADPRKTGLAAAAAPVLTQFGEAPAPTPTVPGYQLLRELGRGGMGVVYQARRESDGCLVALKTILPAVRPTEQTLARFLREANILKQLTHPHIVSFRDLGHADGQLFFAMDFVPGTDVSRILKKEGALPVGRAVRLACQLLDALGYAHGQGFVHRDIKPANLLVTTASGGGPGGEMVKLADFGLARTYQASPLSGLTMTGELGGTPAFMPPEQVLDFRRVQPSADQYSAAATLYAMLANQPLYDGVQSTMDLMLKVLQSDPVPLETRRPELPRGLTAVVMQGLARKPEQRFEDVAALRRALLPFAAG